MFSPLILSAQVMRGKYMVLSTIVSTVEVDPEKKAGLIMSCIRQLQSAGPSTVVCLFVCA